MTKIFLALFTIFSCLSAQEVVSTATRTDLTYKDFAHKYKGCPENSICNPAGAIDTLRWENAIEQMGAIGQVARLAKLRELAEKYGIPANIMGSHEAHSRYNGILYDSPCKNHRQPKEKEMQNIFTVHTFIKKADQDIVEIVSGDKTYQIPRGKIAWTDPLMILQNNKVTTYFVPRGEGPLFFSKDRLSLIIDYLDTLIPIHISRDGVWSIRQYDADTKKYRDLKSEIECPEILKLAKIPGENEYYTQSYCQQIWNEDQQALMTIKRYWACP